MSHMCIKRQRLSWKTSGTILVITICLIFIMMGTTLFPTRSMPLSLDLSCNTVESFQVGRAPTGQTVPKLTSTDENVVHLTGQNIFHIALPIRFC